ncbi:3D domain-containing protein [Paenibacillus hodogayensis]|uniref:3D domain-containing protein n=1 Tax=Paenibacillus hodogayensis TaxID=279208 RepID=A0ABV5VS63_9BACL
MFKSTWKRIWLTGVFALFLLSSSAVSAAGRPLDPTLLQPVWSPLTMQSDFLTKTNADASPYKTLSLYKPLLLSEMAPIWGPMLPGGLSPLFAAIEPLSYTVKSGDTSDPALFTAQKTEIAAAPKAKIAPAAAPVEPELVETKNKIITATGATITPKQTIDAVASAYTGSAAENGGYAGKDYFGNALQVGTIAVDPKIIPLGTTVYVTGYNYDGLPAGGMIAKASDIGGAINGSRIDIYVPDTREKAKKFGYQNVTIYVVD